MKKIDWKNDIPTFVNYSSFNCFECKKCILITNSWLYTECKHYPFEPNN